MYYNFHDNLNELDDLLGMDGLIHQYGFNGPAIAYITDYCDPDNPDLPREEITLETHDLFNLEFTAENHLLDTTHTFTGLPQLPILGQTFDVHVLEIQTDDGEWEEVARGERPHELPQHKHRTETTRIRTESYTYGDDTTTTWQVRHDRTGITTIPEGRRTLTECLQNISEGDSFTVGIDTGEHTFNATAHSISPEELPDDSEQDEPSVPESFTITATDEAGATLTLEHAPNERAHYQFADKHTTQAGGHLTLTRKSPTPPENRDADDIGDITGTVTSMDVPGPNEFKHLPWLADIRRAIDLPKSLTDGNKRFSIGTAYLPSKTEHNERDDYTLYQFDIDQPYEFYYNQSFGPDTADYDPVYATKHYEPES